MIDSRSFVAPVLNDLCRPMCVRQIPCHSLFVVIVEAIINRIIHIY